MNSGMALDLATLVDFVQATQPIQWQRFEKQCNSDPEKKFYKAFENAVENDGLISVLRHGLKHRGIEFRVCYFKPESTLNDVAVKHYGQEHLPVYPPVALLRAEQQQRGHDAGSERHPGGGHRVEKPAHRAERGQCQEAVDV